MNTNDSFDRWLETELHSELGADSSTSAPPPPLYRSTGPAKRLRIAGLVSIPLALSIRTVTALAAAGLAGGGAAIAVTSHATAHPGTSSNQIITLSAASNSASTSNHGSVVTSAVASCKAARPSPDASPKPSPGARGIGKCVSAVASGGHAGGKGNRAGDGNESATAHPTPHAHPTPPPHPTPPMHPTPPPHT